MRSSSATASQVVFVFAEAHAWRASSKPLSNKPCSSVRPITPAPITPRLWPGSTRGDASPVNIRGCGLILAIVTSRSATLTWMRCLVFLLGTAFSGVAEELPELNQTERFKWATYSTLGPPNMVGGVFKSGLQTWINDPEEYGPGW